MQIMHGVSNIQNVDQCLKFPGLQGLHVDWYLQSLRLISFITSFAESDEGEECVSREVEECRVCPKAV